MLPENTITSQEQVRSYEAFVVINLSGQGEYNRTLYDNKELIS